MHAIINIAVNAARTASRRVIRSLDRLDSSRINNSDRMQQSLETQELANEDIANIIFDAYPMHKISTPQTEEINNSEQDFVWLINSIDGVVNYAHGLPYFAVTIAVKYRGKIAHSVIYDPIHDDLFTASNGDGATLNSRRIRVSQEKGLADALLATFQPPELDPAAQNQIISELIPQSAGIRTYGCPALDLAYVAAGRFAGFWASEISEFSLASGTLIVTEAGGIVTDFQGNDTYLETGNIIAASPKNYRTLAKLISDNLTS